MSDRSSSSDSRSPASSAFTSSVTRSSRAWTRRLAMRLEEQVHRPFAAAVIDEADSILIDEARVPLVIAGGDSGERDGFYSLGARSRRMVG